MAEARLAEAAGLAASIGAGISMCFAESLSDNGSLTGEFGLAYNPSSVIGLTVQGYDGKQEDGPYAGCVQGSACTRSLIDAVGTKARLSIGSDAGTLPFLFAGILGGVDHLHEYDGYALLRAVLVPRLSELALSRHSRLGAASYMLASFARGDAKTIHGTHGAGGS